MSEPELAHLKHAVDLMNRCRELCFGVAGTRIEIGLKKPPTVAATRWTTWARTVFFAIENLSEIAEHAFGDHYKQNFSESMKDNVLYLLGVRDDLAAIMDILHLFVANIVFFEVSGFYATMWVSILGPRNVKILHGMAGFRTHQNRDGPSLRNQPPVEIRASQERTYFYGRETAVRNHVAQNSNGTQSHFQAP